MTTFAEAEAAAADRAQLPDYTVLDEPLLSFDALDVTQRSKHPLRGLVEFGPHSAGLISGFLPSVRIATVAPHGTTGALVELVRELRHPHQPRERRDYLVRYPGFKSVFGLDLTLAESARVELPADIDRRIEASASPHHVLAEELTAALRRLKRMDTAFDVVLLLLPARWEAAFTGDDDFDLHDYVKAVTASADMPSQIVRDDHALSYHDRCSVAWRLGIACYVKAGGTPWKLADATPDVAYVGVSYALRPASSGARFVTCCSQVFDAEGTGLEFVAYDADPSRMRVEGDNPFLSRDQMRSVMARALALYQRRHAGAAPNRVAIHKTTRFTPAEAEGCFDAWASVKDVELLQIQQETSWRAVQMTSSTKADAWPVHRGTAVALGGTELLLWTQGNARGISDKGNFFKEQKVIPRPLVVRRHGGHGPAAPACREILGLTKMNWNNDGLYDALPTTLEYASRLARVIKRMPDLDSRRAYPFRLFM